jgi:chorismate mutase
LVDGGIVGVVQQSPATTILLDHAEIALENDLARCIRVEIIEASDPKRQVAPDRARSPRG